MFTSVIFNHIFRTIPFSVLLIVFTTSFISCKKEKKTEGPPVFGTCKEVSTQGHLSKTGTTYVYRTNGGGTITITPTSIIITHDTYAGFKLEYWGDVGSGGQSRNSANHENLNGKHIKDRIGTRRTIIFPDGAKITMVAAAVAGLPISISIYENGESHYINPACDNKLEYSSTNASMAKQLDEAEADGETSTFEFTSTGLLYVTIYTEDAIGNKVMNRVLLGEIVRSSSTLVHDYYDDPRLGHT